MVFVFRKLISLLLLAVLPVAASELPYAFRPRLDVPLAVGLIGMKYHSGSRLQEVRKLDLDLEGLSPRDVPAFDRWAIGFYSPGLSAMSSVLSTAEMAVPIAVNAWDTYHGNQAWHGALVDVLLLQEALLLSSSLSSYAKSLPIHSTPLTFDASVPEGERRQPHNASSFFSNHTASAFTTAVYSAYTFQLRHSQSPLVPWVWGGSLAMASGVGAMRIMAGKHFPSDVLAGAAVGSLCGYLIPRLHLRGPAARKARAGKGRPKTGPKLDLGVTFPEGSAVPGPGLRLRF